jgi:hypothetical protein
MDAQILDRVLQLAALTLGAWIAQRLKTPKSHERAELLSRIAHDAVALIVSTNPAGAWTVLIEQVVLEVSKAAGLHAGSGAIRRAAAAALLERGVKP